jgi:DNA-binding response OmpR family regulator
MTKRKNRTCTLRTLIVEDEDVLAKNLGRFLGDNGRPVAIAHSGEQAVRTAETFGPGCVLADFNLPGINGLQTIARVRDLHPEALFVLMTAQASEAVRAAAREQGVRHVLAKPFRLRDLSSHICGNHPACDECDDVR